MGWINAIVATVVGGVAMVLGYVIAKGVVDNLEGGNLPPGSEALIVLIPLLLAAVGVIGILTFLTAPFTPEKNSRSAVDLSPHAWRDVGAVETASAIEAWIAPKPGEHRKYAPSFTASKYSQSRRVQQPTEENRYESLLHGIEKLREERKAREDKEGICRDYQCCGPFVKTNEE